MMTERYAYSKNKTSAGGGGRYLLPQATETVLGGIKVGNNLSINSSGVLSATSVQTIYGTAQSDDANGSVSVLVDGSSTADVLTTCVHVLTNERVAILPTSSGAMVVGVVGCGVCETVITQAEIDIL